MAEYEEDLVLDFSQVKDGFEAIPKGIYSSYFFDLVKGMSVNNNPKLDITFKISEGAYKGRLLWMHPSLQPQSLWRIKRLLVAVGTTLELTGDIKVSQIIHALENKPCRIIVDCDETKDFPNKVTDVLPARSRPGAGTIADEPVVKSESKVKTKVKENIEELSEDDLPK